MPYTLTRVKNCAQSVGIRRVEIPAYFFLFRRNYLDKLFALPSSSLPRLCAVKLTVVNPTQGVLPPIRLEFESDGGIEDANSPATEAQPKENVLAGEVARKTTNDMIRRATQTIMAWEEERTEAGAEAALAATGRLLAEDPLSIDGMHLMGVALHFLNRRVKRESLSRQHRAYLD